MIRRPPRSTRTDTLFPYTTLFRSLEDATAIFDGALAILAALPAEFGREVVVRHRQAPESRESSARAADFRHSHSTCLAPASGYLSKKDVQTETYVALRDAAFILFPFSSRSEEHTSELQSLMRISYPVFCM